MTEHRRATAFAFKIYRHNLYGEWKLSQALGGCCLPNGMRDLEGGRVKSIEKPATLRTLYPCEYILQGESGQLYAYTEQAEIVTRPNSRREIVIYDDFGKGHVVEEYSSQ